MGKGFFEKWYWCRTYWKWVKGTWWPRIKTYATKTDDAFWQFIAGNWLCFIGVLELFFDLITRPMADIFKLGYYYNGKLTEREVENGKTTSN